MELQLIHHWLDKTPTVFMALHLFYLTLDPRKPCKVSLVSIELRNFMQIYHYFPMLQGDGHFSLSKFSNSGLQVIEVNEYLYFNIYLLGFLNSIY